MNLPDSWDALFGCIRSALNEHAWDREQRSDFWKLLEHAHQRDEARHLREIIPYTTGFGHHFRHPLTTCHDLDELERITQIAPWATFSLEMMQQDLDAQSFSDLIDHPCLSAVARWNLALNELGDEGACALAEASHLTALRSLNLGATKLGSQGTKALAQSMTLCSLTELELGGNDIKNPGLRALSNATFAPSLHTLSLNGNCFTSEGFDAFLRTCHFEALRSLDIGCNDLNLEHLLSATSIPPPYALELTEMEIDQNMAVILATSPRLSSLRYLGLTNNDELGTQGIRQLASSPHLSNVTTLELANTNILDAGVYAICNSPNFTSLRHIDLTSNELTVESLHILSASPFLSQICSLALNVRHKNAQAGFKALVHSPHLPPRLHLFLAQSIKQDALDTLRLAPSITVDTSWFPSDAWREWLTKSA